MEMIFHSHANKTHFQKNGCALCLILKVRVLELGSGLLSFIAFATAVILIALRKRTSTQLVE